MSIKAILITLFFILNLSANERIISLSPSITEIIYALKKGDSLVATSSYSMHPKEAQLLPIIGGYENPHIEKNFYRTKPTFSSWDKVFNSKTLEKLKLFGIKTLVLNLKSINSIKESISLLAKEINSTKDKELIQDIDDALLNAPKAKKAKKCNDSIWTKK